MPARMYACPHACTHTRTCARKHAHAHTYKITPLIPNRDNLQVIYLEYVQTRATPRLWPCESRQICRGYPLSAQYFYSKCITKCLTLKMKVKVTEYNIHNDAIRW